MVSTQQETQQPTAEGWAGQCATYGAQTHTQPETNPSLGALASFPDFGVRWILQSVCFSPCHFLPFLLSLPALLLLSCLFSVLTYFSSLSDIWQRDLVELVFEVSVSQVSHRQRDMLLRQVGVLLGVLDSDIIVREISAFNEHRWVILHHFLLIFSFISGLKSLNIVIIHLLYAIGFLKFLS